MTDHTIETSPGLKARIAGALYLISGTLFVRHACYNWRRRGYGTQHPGARDVLSVGLRSRPHIGPVLYRCDASLVRLAKAGEQEPCFARDGLQPRGIHYWGC